MGLPLETGSILAGAAIAGLGSLAPDIDHPRSTVSRGIPAELFEWGLPLFLLVALLVGVPVSRGDFRGASQTFQSLSSKPLIQWVLTAIILAIGLKAVSFLMSRLFGHRGAMHSVMFAVVATLIAVGVCSYLNAARWYGLVFGWGWLLHLLTDAPSEMGLPYLWWPFAGERRGSGGAGRVFGSRGKHPPRGGN